MSLLDHFCNDPPSNHSRHGHGKTSSKVRNHDFPAVGKSDTPTSCIILPHMSHFIICISSYDDFLKGISHDFLSVSSVSLGHSTPAQTRAYKAAHSCSMRSNKVGALLDHWDKNWTKAVDFNLTLAKVDVQHPEFSRQWCSPMLLSGKNKVEYIIARNLGVSEELEFILHLFFFDAYSSGKHGILTHAKQNMFLTFLTTFHISSGYLT